jgi:hypothetical protein
MPIRIAQELGHAAFRCCMGSLGRGDWLTLALSSDKSR